MQAVLPYTVSSQVKSIQMKKTSHGQIVKIPSNGHSLLLAIKQCLDSDFKIQSEEKILLGKSGKKLKID